MPRERASRQNWDIVDRRLGVLQRRRQGYPTPLIARVYGVSEQTVRNDLKAILEEHRKETAALQADILSEEIGRFEEIHRLAIATHTLLLQERVEVEEEYDPKGRLVKRRVKRYKPTGSPAALGRAIEAGAKICELKGLGKDRFETVAPNQTPQLLRVVIKSREELAEYDHMTMAQLRTIEGTVSPSSEARAEEDDSER